MHYIKSKSKTALKGNMMRRGNELRRPLVQMLRILEVWNNMDFSFLLVVVILCRWEVVGSQSGIQYGPFPVPKDGLPARFWKESSRQRIGCP